MVHGLLQTEAYIRTVMTSVRRRQHPRQIDRAVELRLQRQKVLTRADPVKLWCILNEPVISRLIGGPEVMRGQLARLLEVSEWPYVTLQVLPLSSGVHPALNGPFCILEFPERSDPDVVYSEASQVTPIWKGKPKCELAPRFLTCSGRPRCLRLIPLNSSAEWQPGPPDQNSATVVLQIG